MGNNISNQEISEKEFELWKVAINTQMHFNDLIMKIRAIVTSIITAIVGASAIVLSQSDYEVPICNIKIHISVFVIIFGFILLIAHFIIDYFYYFQLLLGAVECAEIIEKKYPAILTLTTSITKKVNSCHAKASIITYYSLMFLTLLSIIITMLFMVKK